MAGKGAQVKADWEIVERDYSAGVLSIRQIAKIHSVSPAAVCAQAKKGGWTRDQSKVVQARAEKLAATAVMREQLADGKAATAKEYRDAVATVVAQVKVRHRQDIERMRALALRMLAELEAETQNYQDFQKLADLLTQTKEIGGVRRLEVYNKVLSSTARVERLKDLTAIIRTLVTLEREAYGMPDPNAELNANKTAPPPQQDAATMLAQIAAILPG